MNFFRKFSIFLPEKSLFFFRAHVVEIADLCGKFTKNAKNFDEFLLRFSVSNGAKVSFIQKKEKKKRMVQRCDNLVDLDKWSKMTI